MSYLLIRTWWKRRLLWCVVLLPSVFALLAADSAIDLNRILHFPHKGRVQDKYGGEPQPIIDVLISQRTNAIPMLIELLDDESPITNQVVCYWPQLSVGDIALVILTDFFTDSTWTNSTLPGSSWNEVLESKPNSELLVPAYYQLSDFKRKHGEKPIKQKWQQLWSRYQDEVVWDDREKCFRLAGSIK